ELALRLVGDLGGLFGRPQLGLRPLSRRGVTDNAQEPDRHTVGIAVDPALRADPMERRVGPSNPTLHLEGARPEGIVEGLVNGGQVLGDDTRRETLGAPFGLKRGVAKDLVMPE